MKKVFCTILMFTVLLNIAACQKNPDVMEDESSDINSSIISTSTSNPSINNKLDSQSVEELSSEQGTLSDKKEDIYSDSYDVKFSDLSNLEFWFGSGAGAWSTIVTIQPDGTFYGYYHDSEAGDRDTDYPEGTRYECYFSGKFTSLIKISDYEYSMKCESLITEGEVGQEEIRDGVKLITSEPYGFDNADEFLLYLPGKKVNELPEMFLGWVGVNPESTQELTFYGLYNIGGEQGFSSYEK